MALSAKQIKQIVLLNKARNSGARLSQATMAAAVGCSVSTLNRYSTPKPKAQPGTRTRTVTTVKTTVETTSALFASSNGKVGRPPVSEDTKRRILDLRRSGLSYYGIHLELGLSEQTIGRIVRESSAASTPVSTVTGNIVPRTTKPVEESIREFALRLWGDGYTYNEIRSKTGISNATISRYVRKAKDDGRFSNPVDDSHPDSYGND